MSQSSRPRERGTVRRSRDVKLDRPVPLETRSLMAPVVATFPLQATFTAAPTPTNADLGTVVVSREHGRHDRHGGPDHVGVGADAGFVVRRRYRDDRGRPRRGLRQRGLRDFSRRRRQRRRRCGQPAGRDLPGRPGDGQDQRVLRSQHRAEPDRPDNQPGTTAANSLGNSTGLVNWYSITFDSEGLFSGTPAMFVSSVDRSDPNKNIIFEIAPNGTLMGVFVQMTDGLSSLKFNISPTAILVPPVQDQSFLSGLIAGSGISSTSGTFAALYFQSSSYSPGQVISNATLPTGVTRDRTWACRSVGVDGHRPTERPSPRLINTGPIVGLTASNSDYDNQIFSIFTDFGTPAAGGIPARPGFSGVQGSRWRAADRCREFTQPATVPGTGTLDTFGAVSTQFRRFESIAFDQYGYFSQSIALTAAMASSTDRRGTIDHIHRAQCHPRTTAGACSSATWRPACT